MVVCKFCKEVLDKIRKADFIAPQYVGGDENGQVEWHPICQKHKKNWYCEIPINRRLPIFKLSQKHHDKHPDHSLLD